jgi:predicted DsbA family dithiol-disulfide isomerase
MDPIRISYFSDVLCIWAYIAQVRLDELKVNFQHQVEVQYHFVPIFGNTREKLETRWRDRGGLKGYGEHVKEVVKDYPHIVVHPEIWSTVVPASSTSCHLFLQAIQLLEETGVIDPSKQAYERAILAFRYAFFAKLADIADRSVQFSIAEDLALPLDAIQEQIDRGAAYARLSKDFDLVRENTITVSPTLIFNEGRQRLNGNVGYRVIEANIRELLHHPPDEQSWC